MSRKQERPVYAFRREKGALRPDMTFDARALEGITEGQRVRVEIKEFRNVGRHRSYWAMLQDVIDATDCALTAERLHEVLKLETGVVDIVGLPNGMRVAIPGSISFDKMSEAEFIAFYTRAQEWLAKTYGFVSSRNAA